MNDPYSKLTKKEAAESKYLESKGWYTYYNKKFWMHPRIEEKAGGTDLGFLVCTTGEAIKRQKEWDRE